MKTIGTYNSLNIYIPLVAPVYTMLSYYPTINSVPCIQQSVIQTQDESQYDMHCCRTLVRCVDPPQSLHGYPPQMEAMHAYGISTCDLVFLIVRQSSAISACCIGRRQLMLSLSADGDIRDNSDLHPVDILVWR